jgi:hypothetical protein
MIYSPETNNHSKILGHIYIGHCHYIHAEQWSLIHNITYSVRDGFLMLRPTHLAVLLVPP